MVPLWIGVVPFGLAYAVLARDAGLSVVETQALSVLVFAGGAQVSAVGLVAAGAAGLEIVLTTFLLNVRHVLYGLSLGRRIPLDGWRRPAAAYFLTDEAFGVVAARQERTFGFLLGAELSLFVTWNLATLAGALLGSAIPDPEEIGVDLVFPLAFLALLVPLVRTRVELAVAVARAWSPGPRAALPGGIPILVAGVGGSLLGASLTRGRRTPSSASTTPHGRSHDLLAHGGRDARRHVRLALAGLSLRIELPDFWLRFLHFVPIAVFAALVTPSLAGELGEGEIRVAAAGVAALAAWRTENLGLAIAARAGRVLAAPGAVLRDVGSPPSSQRKRWRGIASRSLALSTPPSRSATSGAARRRSSPAPRRSASRSAGIAPASWPWRIPSATKSWAARMCRRTRGGPRVLRRLGDALHPEVRQLRAPPRRARARGRAPRDVASFSRARARVAAHASSMHASQRARFDAKCR